MQPPPHCTYLIANNLLLKSLHSDGSVNGTFLGCPGGLDLTCIKNSSPHRWLSPPTISHPGETSHPFGSSQVATISIYYSSSSPPRSTIRLLIIFLPRNYRPNPSTSSSSISCSSACRRQYYNRISVSVDQVNSSSISWRNCRIVGHYNNYSVVFFSPLHSSSHLVASQQQQQSNRRNLYPIYDYHLCYW